VLVAPWYNPVILARSLATLDVMSGGRLDVGLGSGWSRDEHRAAGAPEQPSGSRFDEFLDVLVRTWTDEVVDHDGEHFQVPASTIGLSPVQRPHPPLVFAAYSPAAMRRIARVGAGWMPAGVPIEGMVQMWAAIKAIAETCGRDGEAIRLIVRGNIWTTERLDGERQLFCGDATQIADDIARCQEIGADEVILDAQFTAASTSTERYVDTIGTIVQRARRMVAVPA
jgi:alkanesulfonate monooxygenase SsuD/methylene tetrahydromethanopterin reductase-like flavin-dependent oxidoreductase (luciferase family)